jgi:hypothetical protein
MPNDFFSFQSSFIADPNADLAGSVAVWTADETAHFVGQHVDAYTEFVSKLARPSYNGGLIRFLLPNTKPSLTQWNSDAGIFGGWPQAKPFFRVFAFDWQGNQLGFDRRFIGHNGEPLISQLEMGTGKVLKMPVTFSELLDSEMIENREAVLCASAFTEWTNRKQSFLPFSRCIGYRQPLFLNGADELDNMEEIDLDVYVTLTGQLFRNSVSRRP